MTSSNNTIDPVTGMEEKAKPVEPIKPPKQTAEPKQQPAASTPPPQLAPSTYLDKTAFTDT